jgi:predicted esterase
MFFETYGAGRAVREATSRGWLVVAPGQGILGLALDVPDLLNALEPWFPIDRSKVMLLGHSMGAAQVIRQVQKYPTLPVAAVALGGGSRFPKTQSNPTSKWFVAAGSDDFGKNGARQLHSSLITANLPSTWREYPNIEHLAIVQAAIPDVFQFLDQSLPPTP